MFLKQLAKVPLTRNEMIQMSESSSSNPAWSKRLSPNPFNVFIYTPEQLGDKNAKRQEQFRKDLQEFLRLDSPLRNFDDAPKVNSNEITYPEYIDICDPKFTRLRNVLLNQGGRSSEWIINHFIKAKDVVVSDEDFFIENLKTWGTDPCGSSQVGSDSQNELIVMTEEKKSVSGEKLKLVKEDEMLTGSDSEIIVETIVIEERKFANKKRSLTDMAKHKGHIYKDRSQNGAAKKEKKVIFV